MNADVVIVANVNDTYALIISIYDEIFIFDFHKLMALVFRIATF